MVWEVSVSWDSGEADSGTWDSRDLSTLGTAVSSEGALKRS